MATLKTTYVDEQLPSGTSKTYNIENSSGSVADDVTITKAYTPTVAGDLFMADDINATNTQVNTNTADIAAISNRVGISVLGIVGSVDDLPSTGSAGSAWAVGTADSNVVYVYDATQSPPWSSIGSVKGETGYSAYEAAVAAGYTGTEAQFATDQANAATYATTTATNAAAAEAAETAAEAAQAASEALLDDFTSIVAGNEAYTKQESDNRYSSAIWLKQTSENEIVQEIYPADGSQLDLTIYGNSTQELLYITSTELAAGTYALADLTNYLTDGSVVMYNESEADVSVTVDGTASTIAAGATLKTAVTTSVTTGAALSFQYLTDTETDLQQPTPNFPAEITSVGDGGSLDVWAGGKNLLDISEGNIFTQTGVNNGTLEFLDDGYIYFENATGSQKQVFFRANIPTGTLHLEIASSTTTPYVGLYQTGATTTYLNAANLTRDVQNCVSIALTTSNLTTVGSYTIRVYSGDTYEHYRELANETLTLAEPLRGLPVTSGGNFTDADGQQYICDTYDSETGLRTNNVAEVVFDGTENAEFSDVSNSYADTVRYMYSTYVSSINFTTTTKCSHLLYRNSSLSPYGYYAVGGGGIIYVFLQKSVVGSTSAEVKAYLASLYSDGNPITVQYQLATPTTETIDTLDLVMTQSDKYNPESVQVITSEGEFDCGYNKDGTYAYTELMNAILDAGGTE